MKGNPWPHYPASLHSQRIGVMHCCWSKTSFAEHCRLSAQLGAGYIEDFGYHLGSSRIDLSAARDALAEAKIPLLLVIAPDLDCSHPHDMESLARCIERWQEIGLTTFVTLRTKKGPDMKDFLVTLEAAASVVRHAGLMPLAQNHRGGLMESPDDLLRCREAGVDLHYDTQQWPMSGHDALTAWDQVGPYVRHAHLGDRTAEIEGCPFGTGIVRIRDLLQRMHAGGYRGAMTVETEYGPDDATGTAIVQQAIDFVTGVLTPFGATGIALPPGHAQVAAKAVKVIQTTWGTLHWISDGNVFADCGQTLGLVTVHAGWSNGVHRHPSDQEILYVRRGKCRHQCGDQEVLLEPGDVLFIPAGQAHGAVNIGDEPLELIVNYPTGHRSFESIRKAERIS